VAIKESVTDGAVTDSYNDEATTEQSNAFPTPLPFLDEPEEAYDDKPETRPSFPNIPPGFDLSKIKEIIGTGSNGDKGEYYIGRATCGN
jgi:hypothetical protein